MFNLSKLIVSGIFRVDVILCHQCDKMVRLLNTVIVIDIASSVSLLSSVINSYSMDTNTAAEIGRKLAKVIDSCEKNSHS